MENMLRLNTKMERLFIFLAFLSILAVSPIYAFTDTDGDLMPDNYETTQGFDLNDPLDADYDADSDLLLNAEEYLLGLDPHANNPILSDRDLVRLFQIKTFRFYWLEATSPYYFVPDSAEYNGLSTSENFNSNAGIGFQIAAYVVADQNNWVDHKLAYERIHTILSRFTQLQDPSFDNYGPGTTNSQKGNRHGYTYHFVTDTGIRAYDSEISTIDHALFLSGAILAGEYYKDTEVESLAEGLFLATDWEWLYNGGYLYQGWRENSGGSFEGGDTLDQWNRYSELMVLLVMAMGSYYEDPAKGISSSAWDNLNGFPNEVRTLHPGDLGFVDGVVPYKGGISNSGFLTYLHAGSIHNHQYSHMFLDFRGRPDKFGNNYFNNSIAATLVNRQYCIDLNSRDYGANDAPTYEAHPYSTYGDNQWGLVAGYTADPSSPYKVNQPIVPPDSMNFDNVAGNNDSGTVFTYAPMGSLPFAPDEVKSLIRNLFDRYREQILYSCYEDIVGRYGFMGAFNFGKTYTGQDGHFFQQVLSIDEGPVILMNEDYLSGLPWKFFKRSRFIKNGLQAAGFSIYPVEPYVMNFDDNPPLPADNTAGGSDPNSFGGYSGGWGPTDPGVIEYVDIGDPRPDIPYGPQGWARRITANEAWDGVWIGLNNHSISDWDRLSFWVKGEYGGEEFEVGLKDGDGVEYKVPIADYAAVTTEWQEVRIPLEVFRNNGIRSTGMDNISFTSTKSGGGIVYIDDIAFLGDEFKPANPQNITASKTYDGTITLSWDRNSEADVVGYNVYRADERDSVYAKVNSFLIVGNSFVDNGLTPLEDYYYKITAVDNAASPNESDFSVISGNDRETALSVYRQYWQGGNNNYAELADGSSMAIPEADAARIILKGSDEDGDTLTYNCQILSGPGEGRAPLIWKDVTIPSLGGAAKRLMFTPDLIDSDTSYVLRLSVSDGTNTVSKDITVEVTNDPGIIPGYFSPAPWPGGTVNLADADESGDLQVSVVLNGIHSGISQIGFYYRPIGTPGIGTQAPFVSSESDPHGVKCTFSFPIGDPGIIDGTTYDFELGVIDGEGNAWWSGWGGGYNADGSGWVLYYLIANKSAPEPLSLNMAAPMEVSTAQVSIAEPLAGVSDKAESNTLINAAVVVNKEKVINVDAPVKAVGRINNRSTSLVFKNPPRSFRKATRTVKFKKSIMSR